MRAWGRKTADVFSRLDRRASEFGLGSLWKVLEIRLRREKVCIYVEYNVETLRTDGE
jgi:hypothetical protein